MGGPFAVGVSDFLSQCYLARAHRLERMPCFSQAASHVAALGGAMSFAYEFGSVFLSVRAALCSALRGRGSQKGVES